MKRMISVVLALVLLAACFPAGALAEDEKYTYKVLTFQAGSLDDNAPMVEYWSDYYGVEFKVESVEQSNADELMPLRMLDKETPDIIYWHRDRLMGFVEEEMCGTFPVETLQKYAPKIYAEMAAKEGLIDYCSIDGELFTLGYQPYSSKYPNLAVWRKAWLDAVGEEVPKTLADAERVWYAFTKNDPDGNGKNDTYGLSAGGMNQVYFAYGLYDTWIKDENGQLVNWNVAPARREALAKLAQYYADGVLDPEFITGENNGGYWAVSHAFANGRIGFTQFGNYTHWPLTYEATNAETFANGGAIYQSFPDEVTATSMPYVYAEPLEGPSGFKTYGPAKYTTLVSFSPDFIKDEERFARFLQIAEDLGGYNELETYICARYGQKDVHWNYDADGFAASLEGYATTAERVAIGALITFQFAVSDAAESALQNKVGMRRIEACEALDYVTSPIYVTGTLPSAADYQTELDKLASETFIDIITGKKDITAFDRMVEDWYAIGGKILTEEANELYNK